MVSWYPHRHQLGFHLEISRCGDSLSLSNKSSHCIGDSSSIFEDYFLLLPESYNSARSNQLQFLAEYVDVDEGSGDMEITFNEEVRLSTDFEESDKMNL